MVGSPRLMDWRLMDKFFESSRRAAVKYGIFVHSEMMFLFHYLCGKNVKARCTSLTNIPA